MSYQKSCKHLYSKSSTSKELRLKYQFRWLAASLDSFLHGLSEAEKYLGTKEFTLGVSQQAYDNLDRNLQRRDSSAPLTVWGIPVVVDEDAVGFNTICHKLDEYGRS